MLVQVSDATVGAFITSLGATSWDALVKGLSAKFGAHRWQVMIELSRFSQGNNETIATYLDRLE